MVMQAMRYGASNKYLKTILFGILMLAAVGLMVTGGTDFSGGVARSDVAKIGSETISLASFDRNVRRSLNGIGIQPEEAFKLGYMNQVLANEIRSRLMALAARDNGVLIDRARIAGQIRDMIRPMVKEGQKEEDVLKMVLLNQGLTEGELVNSMQREMASNLLAGAIQRGFSTFSDDALKDFYINQNEKRDIQYVTFLDKDAPEVAAPPETDLMKLYETGKERFSIPETRILQLIKVKDENLKKTLEISDEELHQNYEDNKDTYFTAASHTLERSLFEKEDEAKKVREAMKAGKSMEAAVKEITKNAIAYLGEQELEDEKIQPDVKELIKDAKQGDVVGPAKTSIGWQIFTVKKIYAGGQKSFDDVKAEIKKDLYDMKLSDAKYDLANQVEDLFASGTPLEEIAKQVDIETTDLPSMNRYGQGADGKDALKDYDKTGPAIVENGFRLAYGETSPVSEMADGSFMAIHAKSITPKSYKPFDEVKADLSKQWTDNQRRNENTMRVAGYIDSIRNGDKTLKDVAEPKELKAITRNAELPKPLTPESAAMIFGAEPGEPVMIGLDGGAGIAIVTDFHWPEKVDVNGEDFKKFKESFTKDLQSEAIAVYMDAKNKKYKALVNEKILAQVYGGAKTEQ